MQSLILLHNDCKRLELGYRSFLGIATAEDCLIVDFVHPTSVGPITLTGIATVYKYKIIFSVIIYSLKNVI